jgi:hypothetical protein
MDRVSPAPDAGLWTVPVTLEMTPDTSPTLPGDGIEDE